MFHLIPIILGLARITQTEIILTDLTRHPGLIAFEERETKVIKSYHLHLHVIQLEIFQSCFENLNYTLKSLGHSDDADEFREILQMRMNGLLESFRRIQPTKGHRHRRGIFNPLGTIIKSISGNLDNDDLQDIHKILGDYRTKTDELIRTNERQIQINDDYQTKINSIVKHINTQQIQFMKEISAIKNQIPTNKNILFSQLFYKLLFNIDMLEKQARDIFESVQMSRIGILPKAILSQNETFYISKLLEDQEVEISNFDQVFEYLKVHALHNETHIIFAVQIPKFLIGKFRFVTFESIPKDNKMIVTNFKIAILGKNVTFVSSGDCPIVEQYRLCNYKDLIDISDDQCVSNALQGTEAACDYKEIQSRAEIRLVNGHTAIIKNAIKPIDIFSDGCNLKPRQITGTVMVTFEKCSMVINGSIYNAEETMDQHKLMLIPMFGINFQQSTITKEIELQELKVMHTINRNHVSQLQIRQEVMQKISLGSFILVLLTIIISITTVWKSTRCKEDQVTAGREEQRFPPVFISLEEGPLRDSGRIFSGDGIVNDASKPIHMTPQPQVAQSASIQ